MTDKKLRWEQLRSVMRTFNAGDWIATVVFISLLGWVLWHTAGNLWNMALFSLQPALPDSILASGDRYDLISQRSMAAAAWWMVVITGISSLIGVASLYLIFRTLQEARRSADAAHEAVKAAVAGTELTQRANKDQVRAYLVVTFATVYRKQELSFEVGVKNSGQTPATDIVMWARSTYETEFDGRRVERFILGHYEPRSPIASGEQRTYLPTVERHHQQDFEAALKARDCLLTLDVKVTYNDVFGEKQAVYGTYSGDLLRGAFPANFKAQMYRDKTRNDW